MSRAAAVALMLISSSAAAEPWLAVREGAKCSLCHVNRSGGGKRTRFGSVYAQTVLPTFKGGAGDGLLGGVVSAGADLRANHLTSFGKATSNTFDVLEANLYVEATLGPATLALDETLAPGGAESREAYGLLQGPWGTWLRAGLILLPFGLRVWDDEAFTRKATGFNYASSDLGIELGVERGVFGAQVAIVNGTIGAADDDDAKQIAGVAQVVLPWGRLGASGSWNDGAESTAVRAGGFVGATFGRVTVFAEVDWLRDEAHKAGRALDGLVALAEIDLLIVRGLSLKAVYELQDPYLDVAEDQRTRARVAVEWFVLPMVQASVSAVFQDAPPQDEQGNVDLLTGELHVFF